MTGAQDTKYETDPTIRTYRAKIQVFLEYFDGTFRTSQVYEAIGADTTEKKNSVRQALHKEKLAGTIELTGTYGTWRKVNKDIEWCDLGDICQNPSVKKLNVNLPLRMDSLISIFPGDLIVVAGVTNTGKSSFALEMAIKNKSMGVKYLSSELTIAQVQDRARKDNIGIDSLSGIQFALREDSYQDVVEPGKLNIVDYLDAPGSDDNAQYFLIPPLIGKIHKKMSGTGLTLICIQKDPGKETGDGGFKTTHRANLYLTTDKDHKGKYWMNICKCKARSTLEGYRVRFSLKPFSLVDESDWIPP